MSREHNSYSSSLNSKVFLICSALLFCGATATFIWILVNAIEFHFIKNILYSIAFLIISAGVLIYSLRAYRHPDSEATVLWVTMALGIATFIAGLSIKQDAPTEIPTHVDNTVMPSGSQS